MFVPALCLAVAAKWTLVLGGDIMLNGVNPSKSPFAGIAGVLKRGDAVLANLEVPMTAAGTPTRRKTPAELKARKQFVLRANPGHLRWVKAARITAVSLGNNHAMDYGPIALAGELKQLDKLGIHHAGAGANETDARSVTVISLSCGVKVGLISGLAFVGAGALGKCTPATDDSAGVNGLNLGGVPTAEKLKGWVKAAHKRCDVLVVALHGGIERQPFPTAYQVTLARAFIDAGADVVWGHHPHVLEGAELYKGHPILYSMGNLVSPTPANTGLVELRFLGTSLERARFFPAKVSGGHVAALKGREATVRTAAFRRLCSQTAVKVHGNVLPISSN